MGKGILYNPVSNTSIEVDITEEDRDIEELRTARFEELMEVYKDTIVKGFTSEATGEPVLYGYSQQDQLNYAKWANVFSLNPAKDFVIIGSISHGVVHMTREQFIVFMDDAETYEVSLYTKRKMLEATIAKADKDTLVSMVINL